MFIIKIVDICGRDKFSTYARTYTIEDEILSYSPDFREIKKTKDLLQKEKVYIMNMSGDTVDKFKIERVPKITGARGILD